MKYLLTVLLSLAPALTWGSQVCFQDRPTYDRVRAQLPPLMRQSTVTLVHQSKSLIAGVRIFPAGARFKLESHMWHNWMGVDQGEDEIREICYANQVARVELKSGTKQNLRVDGRQVDIKGYPFTSGSNADFRKIINLIGQRSNAR